MICDVVEQWQKRLQQIELPVHEGKEAGLGNQHRVG